MRAYRKASLTIVVVTLLALGPDARAQGPRDVGPSAVTPGPPQDTWPLLSDEQLGLVPPRRPLDPPPPQPPPAVEPPAPAFGEAGELVITGDSSIGISTTQYSGYQASSFSTSFSPGGDVFVLRGLSIGVDVDARYSSRKGYGPGGELLSTTSSGLAGGPRLGFNVTLGSVVSWYPRVTVGGESVRLDVHDSSASTFDTRPTRFTESGLFVSAFAPLLLHPRPHFFVGFGPSAFHAFGLAHGGGQSAMDRTTIAARFVVGGWWGGPASAPSAPASRPPADGAARRVPRFGTRGQWVFTGELGGAASRTQSEGVGPSAAVTFVPGFDYFVGAGVSLGMSVTATRAHAADLAPNGVTTTTDASSLAIGVRVGGDLPLSPLLSFYPRASLSAGRSSSDQRAGSERSQLSGTVVTVGLYAPLLVHLAPHAFAGFGPLVAHEALHTVDGRFASVLATRIGANLVVGGWL